MASVSFIDVGKTYADGTHAVDHLNLEIEDGEFLILVGPSGCGKTTALRMVAGLEDITSGEVRIDGVRVNNLEPPERDIAMVFQNYALYPHMSVFDNIGFPLAAQGVKKPEIRERVTKTAAMLGLEEHLKRRPKNLSGGQRQRVAMGRAIVRQPRAFLLDEPLSNLDAKLRVQMRAEICGLQRELGVTTIYVTHDQVEAMTMGDRIAVMRKGVLQQIGKPQELYDRPANLFVATFVGSPAMNLFVVDVEEGFVCVGEQRISVSSASLGPYIGRRVALGVRPEHMLHPRLAGEGAPTLSGEITLVEALGFERLVHVRVAGDPAVTDEVLEVARDTDDVVAQTWGASAQERHVNAVARFDPDIHVEPGATQKFALRPDKLLFFDLDSGKALA